MKYKKYIKSMPSLIMMSMLLITCLFIYSCKEEEEITQVVLHSFGPSGVKHGDQIKFIGINLDKVSSIVLPGVEVASNQFVTQSSNLIELVVPLQAEAGKVTLKTPQGDVISKSMLSFNVPVVIESITAEAKPGTNISIKGNMVNWINEVVFTDNLIVKEFVSKSLTELVVKVPMEAQTGFLIFKNGGTQPLSFASEEELIVTLPEITSLSPASVKHTDNLTITGTDLDLVTSIVFEGEKTVDEFVSQTETQIVVAVPTGAMKGKIVLKQASPVDVESTDEITIILPKGSEVKPKPAVPGTDDITISGTDLDLIATLTLPGSGEIEASKFKSHTATKIVLAFPEGSKSGSISYTTIHGFSANLGLTVTIPGAGPSPLQITLYDETLAAGGGDWSWSKVISDQANTEHPYSGDVAWKFETDNGGGVSGGGYNPVDVSAMKVFVFSLYGGPGTNNADVAVILNDKWDSYNSVKIVEGQWTTYEIPLSSFATVDLTAIVRWTFKVEGMNASTIYVDRVGFDMGGPAALERYIFDDAPQNGFGTWGGWGATSFDVNSTEQVRTGSKSIKANYGGDWGGAAQFGGATLSTDGATHYVFSIYGGEGTDGKNIRAIVKSSAGEGSKDIAITEGGWTEVEIPLTDIGSPADIKEIAFQDTGFTGTVYFDRIGLK